jgi:hypothetical protein
MSIMGDPSEPSIPTTTSHRRWYRLALGATILLVIGVLILLPVAIVSMRTVLGKVYDPLFDLRTGQPLSEAEAHAAEDEGHYVNLGITSLDPATGTLTLAVSGNRICSGGCPKLVLTFVSLDDDADQRRGLPPSVSVTLQPEDVVFSQAVQLPVRGQPSLYPFDSYQLWLGTVVVATLPDGSTIELTPEIIGGSATVTLQNRVGFFVMQPPAPIDRQRITAATDPYVYLTIQGLQFDRPAYLQILTVVLVLLIAISALMALFTRAVDDLALGIGGLILGVWGVRSVLVTQPLPTPTLLDLALSWLIMLLLLGLAIRAAHHFHRRSDLPLPRPSPPRPRRPVRAAAPGVPRRPGDRNQAEVGEPVPD